MSEHQTDLVEEVRKKMAKTTTRKNAPSISPHMLARWYSENDANPRRITAAANAYMESEKETHRFDVAGIKSLYNRLNIKLKSVGVMPLKLKSERHDFAAFVDEWKLKGILYTEEQAKGIVDKKSSVKK